MMLALGPLGFAPQVFWNMSPVELQAAIDGLCGGGRVAGAAASLSRREMDELSAQFPDGGSDE